jgi:hypothetical protein
MKYIPGYLDSFISPISGQMSIPGLQSLTTNYVWLGDRNDIAQESPILIDIRLDILTLRKLLATTPFILQTGIGGFDNAQALDILGNGFLYTTDGILSIGIPGPGTLVLPYGMVYVGNVDNFAEAVQTITQDNLPDLTENYLWIGDSSNRPTPISTFNGNFGLTSQYIWRGNGSNLAIPVNDLTTLEGIVADQGNSILDLINGLSSLVNIVNGLTSTVNAIEAGLALIGGFPALVALIANVAALDIAVPATNARIDNLTLDSIANNKATAGDVNINNHKLINVSNATGPLDAVNLQQLQSLNTTLTGAVSGSGNTLAPIVTTLNTTLDAVPLALGNVNINNNRLINVSDPIDSLDAVNLETLISYIDDVPGEITITLGGAVSGSGLSNTTIMTTLNTTLDAVPLAVSNVNINNNKLINVADATNPLDAVNLETLETYIIDNVTPILYVDGASQTIYYNSEYNITTFNIINNFIPEIGNSARNDLILTTRYGTLTLNWNSYIYSSLATAPVFTMYYDSDIADITNYPFLSVTANDADLGSEIQLLLQGRTIIDTYGSYFSILHDGITVFDIEQDGEVNCNDNSIIDLKTLSFSNWSDMEAKAQYATNYLFLWQLFGGGVS